MKKWVITLIILFLIVGSMMAAGEAEAMPSIPFPTDNKEIQISGTTVKSWADFSNLKVNQQATYLERLTPSSRQQVLDVIEPTRKSVLQGALQITTDTSLSIADKLQLELAYWTKNKAPLPTEIFVPAEIGAKRNVAVVVQTQTLISQPSAVSNTPTAGELTSAQKGLISSLKTSRDEVVEEIVNDGISMDDNFEFVRDENGYLHVTIANSKTTTIYDDNGVVVTPTPPPEPNPTQLPAAPRAATEEVRMERQLPSEITYQVGDLLVGKDGKLYMVTSTGEKVTIKSTETGEDSILTQDSDVHKAKLDEVQKALAAKRISHSQAYDAMKVIADKKKEEYDVAVKALSDVTTVGTDGKIKDTVKGSNLDILAGILDTKRITEETDENLRKRIQKILDQKKTDSLSSNSYSDTLRWSGTWLENLETQEWYKTAEGVGLVLSGGFEVLASLGEYRALSNLLFPETTKEWQIWANNEVIARWADLPNFIATELCLEDNEKRANKPGQSAAFITTSEGTEQSVGAINAERSPTKFPILCAKNKEDEWTCPKDLICKDDTFCYKDKKAEKPEEGYFYKITWGVTAPTDEKFTPYVDEASGIVTKFNVYLDTLALYRKKGVDPKEVIQLPSGGHDGGMIVRYLPAEYQQVCIKFAEPIQDRDDYDIDKICTAIITSDGGVVEFASSSKSEPVTSTSEEVELEI